MPRTDGELVPGTFDLLILTSLARGAMHGWGIADRIEQLSEGVFVVQQGAVYPALQRLLKQGLVSASWRESENNRRARFYKLTAAGQRYLGQETAWWKRASNAIDRVVKLAAQNS